MALSKEVEIILKANANSVKAAFDTITAAAAASTEDAVKDTLNSYATKVADTAASVVERVLDKKNFSAKLGEKLRAQVEAGAQGITSGIQDAVALAKAGNDAAAAERLKGIRSQMLAFEKMAGEDFQDSIKIGVKDAFSMENLRDATGGIADLFEKALNSVDVNDLGGLGKSLGGALSKGFVHLAKGQKAQETAALAAGDEAAAAAAADMAVALGAAAAAATAVAAAFALFVAWADAADKYQAQLNKTILNGVGVADLLGQSYQSGATSTLALSDTLMAARKAATSTAVQFRTDTEEMAGVLADLNSAGITYATLVDGANTGAMAQQRFTTAISKTVVAASMLGVSVSELTQYQGTLIKDVNLSLGRTFDVFGAISEAAKSAGMAEKTFFTAISQATSGMALYNVRVDQAIGLLKHFSKSIGETNAKKLLDSLGGTTDPQTRLQKLAVATGGGKNMAPIHDIFRLTTEAAVDELGSTFAKSVPEVQGKLRKVLEDEGLSGLLSKDAKEKEAAIKKMSELDSTKRESIVTQLLQYGGGGFGRMFGAAAMSAKGMTGDLNTAAGVADYLDMSGRLALLNKQLETLAAQGVKPEDIKSNASFQMAMEAFHVSQEQYEALIRERSLMQSVERVQKGEGVSEAELKALREFLTVDVAGRSVKSRSGDEIKGMTDLIFALTPEMVKASPEDTARAAEMKEQQGTITAALNAWVKGKLFDNALAPRGLLGKILYWVSGKASDPVAIAKEQEAYEKDLESRTDALSAAASQTELTRQKYEGAEETPAARAALAAADAAEQKARKEYSQTQAAMVFSTPEAVVPAGELSESFAGTEFGSTPEGQALMQDYEAKVQAYKDAKAIAAALTTSDPMGGYHSDTDADFAAETAKRELEAAAEKLAGRDLTISTVKESQGFFGRLVDEALPMMADYSPVVKAVPREVQDAFISKDGAMYHGPSADNILMFKDGGPLDPRTGGGGGNVVININGGDQAMVYRTVARAMRAAQA